ncbi:MAG TPA: 3-oxoadipate enol-lactonase [Kofleriaceae bacterium]|nr:3-oxoadipate enol-lactonase [Kofleriaceae bacterium]
MTSGPATLHHHIDGPDDAPVVVLSHPLGGSLALWEPQMAALTASFRVVRCDLRGHGLSPVPAGPYEIADLGTDVLALLDHLGAERAHLVGLSLGGMVSMWLAARHPDRIDRLVVLCSSARLGPPERWIERSEQVRAGGTEAVADAAVARWFTPAFLERHPQRAAAMRAVVAATPAEGYAACCGAVQRMDLTDDLAAIRAPTLAVAGADDLATPPEHLERIASAIAGARLEVIEEAAHLASVEQADRVNALILSHLGGKGAA